jgi:peptidoglycan/xylan/chitin deacetylase (PgdA/CDA1 family)
MSGRDAAGRASDRTYRRRRLGVMMGAGAIVVLVALAADAVAGPDGPRGRASLAGARGPTTTTTRVPPWVWDRPPSAPVPVQAAGGVAPVITRVETTDPVVFLTIDDGTVRSPEAMAAFRELGIPASLFLIDGPITQDAGWFGQLPGTLVESHSQTHADFRGLSEAAQQAEICGNADLIERTYGRRPVLFRPPYGNYDAATQRAAAACGMRAIVIWQETVNADVVAFREVTHFRPGDVILMHFRDSFVQELQVVRDRVHEAGLRFALLEDYVAPDTVIRT